MANSFKANVAINVETSDTGGNTIYTCPAATQTTIIGMSVSNKSASAITANVIMTRSAVDYFLVANAPISVGSTLIPIGGDQKLVMEPNDILKVSVSANGSSDVILSLLEIT